MRGDTVLWVPGSDHAGIATQVRCSNYLDSRCISRLATDHIGKGQVCNFSCYCLHPKTSRVKIYPSVHLANYNSTI